MMYSAKGSISLPCLLAALLLALSAQLSLLYAVRGYESEKDYLREQQLSSFAIRESCSRTVNR